MIRVNLLRNRKDGGQPLTPENRGASTFISGHEVLLAAFFLVLGAVILWFVLSHGGGEPISVVAESARPAPKSETPSTPPTQPERASVSPTANTSSVEPSTPAIRQTQDQQPVLSSPVERTATPAEPDPDSAPTTPPATAHRSTLLGSKGVITMNDLRVQVEGNALQIFAGTDGRPDYDMFRLENPHRVVIDLPGVRHELAARQRNQEVAHPVVTGLRLAQNQLDPPLVRLVLEVASFPEIRMFPRADGLVISVTGQ